MSEWVNTVSDWVSAHLPTIIAIVTSGAFVGALTNFLLRLWLIKIQSKTTAKNNEAVTKKYELLENKVDNVVKTLEGLFTKLMQDYSKLTKEQFADLMQQYQKTKQEYLNAIITADTETALLIEKAREIANEVQEAHEPNEVAQEESVEESVENTENIENNAEIEPENKQVEQEVGEEETTEESEYIVVEKVYGE